MMHPAAQDDEIVHITKINQLVLPENVFFNQIIGRFKFHIYNAVMNRTIWF